MLKHVRRGRREMKLSSANSNNLGVLLHSAVTIDNDDILCSFDKPKERNQIFSPSINGK